MKSFETRLRHLCSATTSQVFDFLGTLGFEVVVTGNRRYAYRAGLLSTSPLVVCHADTVVNGGDGPHNYAFNKKSSVVTSIALDDRLGIACMVHAIEEATPLADCAMLVCDEEEVGNTTAKLFTTDSEPNWMVELDRRGTDVVAYEYDSTLLRSLLTSVGFSIGNGSFSDICSLTHLGVVGFNVGVGYHREHSKVCHANLLDTFMQISRLHDFLAKFGDIRLDYDGYQDTYYIDDYGYDDRDYKNWPPKTQEELDYELDCRLDRDDYRLW